MELRELEWFVTLAETEHVTAAANQLSISQPTMSRALRRLERNLGVELFDRTHNRLHLNKFGEIFRVHAVRAMNELSQGEERINTLIDPSRGLVSVGFLHSFGTWLVPQLLDAYKNVANATTFELRGGAADAVLDDVRHGRVDIGIVAPRPVADDLAWVGLGREHLRLGLSSEHELRDRDSVGISELGDEAWVALKAGYGLRQVMDRLFMEADIQPRIVIEVTELSTMRSLVAAGMGIALVPAIAPDADGAVRTVTITDAGAFRDYGVLTRLHGPSGPAARRFLQFVAGGATELPLPD